MNQKNTIATIAAMGAVVLATLVVAASWGEPKESATCGAGFARVGARCCVAGNSIDTCSGAPNQPCPSPLISTDRGCDAPDTRVLIGRTELTLGPSDWEAEGRVSPRVIRVTPFEIDAFETTVGKIDRADRDPARAATALTRSEAAAHCASRGGRLPTEDEWIAAASGEAARRYAWGDTGAVCRRAAWGLLRGPCGENGGVDTVGAHADGASRSGLFDMAGNAAEWVRVHDVQPPIAKGGSWASSLAAELRNWSTLVVSPESHDARVGVRCAYDAK